MVGQRGWIALIGLTVFLTAGGECGYNDQCCLEDWKKVMEPVLKAIKEVRDKDPKDFSGFSKPAFNKTFAPWHHPMNAINMIDDEEGEGICQGKLSLKCVVVGQDKVGRCKCNADKPFDFEPNKKNTTCVAKGVGSLCYNGTNKTPCNEGAPCLVKNKDAQIGECAQKEGVAAVNGKNGGPSRWSQSQSPIIMGVLVTIFLTVIGMEGRLSDTVAI